MNTWTRIGLVALMAAALTTPASALTVIDDFSDGGVPPLSVSARVAGDPEAPESGWAGGDIDYSSTFETGLSGVLGGTRKMELELQTVTGTYKEGTAYVDRALGVVEYSNASGVDSVLTLTYDADDSGNVDGDGKLVHDGGGLAADLSQGGANVSVLIEILSTDLNGDIMVTVVDGGGTVAERAETFVSQGAGTIAFDFADFVVLNGGDDGVVDWTDIDTVQFVFDPIEAGDMTFSILGTGTIPEPLTMLAVGSAVVGVGGYIRRRRRDA